jgi:hypothetical protein
MTPHMRQKSVNRDAQMCTRGIPLQVFMICGIH